MTIRTLKIKIKSLAAESKIIRFEENKLKPPRDANGKRAWDDQRLIDYTSLHEHRTYEVRKASREALLAYGFLHGRTYSQLERSCYTQPNWPEIEKLVKRFEFKKSNTPLDSELLTWRDTDT